MKIGDYCCHNRSQYTKDVILNLIKVLDKVKSNRKWEIVNVKVSFYYKMGENIQNVDCVFV